MADQELDEHFEKLHKIGKFYKIKSAQWSMEEPVDYDFSKKVTEATVYFQSRYGGKIYKLVAPTYLDIWRAFDKSVVAFGPLDHVYLEDFVIEGDQLVIHTGS